VRVDFRVDDAGRPWILEVNTNPCLSPDAGFQAALREAGIPLSQAIDRIIRDALRRAAGQGPFADLAKANVVPGPVPSSGPAASDVQWRFAPSENDPAKVRELVTATGYFYPDEVAVAQELVAERLAKGESSGYYFVFAERDGELLGYACYGPIACTRDSYDLYWIAVHPRIQKAGLGRRILRQAEECIRQRGGGRVYIETSNRAQYASTRAFYLRCGYHLAATLAEFYGPGDDKVIYERRLHGE
jgi:GNAT superfamily N-acetyltransferase